MKKTYSRSGRGLVLILGLGLILPLLAGQGCPMGAGSAPVVTIVAPSVSQTVAIGTSQTLVYTVTNPGDGDITISAFYDRDGQASTGDEVGFATNLPAGSNQSATLDTSGLDEGQLYLGIVAVNSSGTTVAYASGVPTLTTQDAGQDQPDGDGSTGNDGIVGGIGSGGDEDDFDGDAGDDGSGGTTGQLLVMTAPGADLKVIRGTTFTIRWRTKLRLGEGVINVFREPDADQNRKPDGAGSRVVLSQAGLDASTLEFDFDTSGLTGTQFIGATVIPEDDEEDPVTEYAPGTLTITPPLFWVGDLVTKFDDDGDALPLPGPMEGALFEGVNNGDNMGSTMLSAPDFNGDGLDEVLLGSQYAKPGFQAAGGRGAGEAYLFYAQGGRGLLGTIKANQAGDLDLPGLIFQGIFPNPNPSFAQQGNRLMDLVADVPAAPFASEGLRSIIRIPDQDGDGIEELVFSFPFVDSYSLSFQISDGYHPSPLIGLGRLENNGQFMRGGAIIVSSTNSLLNDEEEFSRHGDRTMMLQEVGQVFDVMSQRYSPRSALDAEGGDFGGVPALIDACPRTLCDDEPPGDGELDISIFPGEGFVQDTLTESTFPIFALPDQNEQTPGSSAQISENYFGIGAPRLADPVPSFELRIAFGEFLLTSQIDLPPSILGGREFDGCISDTIDNQGNPVAPFGLYPPSGYLRVGGSGFYYDELPVLGPEVCQPTIISPYSDYCPANRISDPVEPIGARILGQINQKSPTNPISREIVPNRFGHSMAVSGEFLLIGTPDRTVEKGDVTAIRNNPSLGNRESSGEIYMLQMVKPTLPQSFNLWDSQNDVTQPAPHQYIIQDIGYTRCESPFMQPGDAAFEMARPFHIVGAAPGDRIGDVTSLEDMNRDGVEDIAVGGSGTNGDRGSIYVIYRRQPELEADYLLENLHISPSSLDRLNGLYIVGRPGERLGTAMAGGGDFNDDGSPDLLIGSPTVTGAAGFESGEVFIYFGGTNLLSPEGGITIPELRDMDYGMVLAGASREDHAGTTVADAGDVNGDGINDILIAAPDASPMFDSTGNGQADAIGIDLNGDLLADDLDKDGDPDDLTDAGLVYIVFGGRHLTGNINLREIGTDNLPGLTIVGRQGGDHLGGGRTQNGLLSRGVAPAGDVDGDGLSDIFVSSVLADPDGKTNAGEIYLLYGGFELDSSDD